MTKKIFMQQVTERVKELSPKENAQIYCDIFFKNNSTERYGIVVRLSGDEMVYPTIYIDRFYDRFLKKKETIDDVARHVWEMVNHIEGNKEHYQDFSFDWECCENKIVYRLISKKMNGDLLRETPHIPFLDMAVIFGMVCSHTEEGVESLTINQSLSDYWNVSVSDLFHAAEKNTPHIFPAQRRNLLELVFSYIGMSNEDLPDEIANDYPPLQFISNAEGVYGAAVVLYPGYLDKIAEEFSSDLFVIPSSIHEMLVLPVNLKGVRDEAELPDMVKRINQDYVRDDEVLSDNIYLYNRKNKKLEIKNDFLSA